MTFDTFKKSDRYKNVRKYLRQRCSNTVVNMDLIENYLILVFASELLKNDIKENGAMIQTEKGMKPNPAMSELAKLTSQKTRLLASMKISVEEEEQLEL